MERSEAEMSVDLPPSPQKRKEIELRLNPHSSERTTIIFKTQTQRGQEERNSCVTWKICPVFNRLFVLNDTERSQSLCITSFELIVAAWLFSVSRISLDKALTSRRQLGVFLDEREPT